MRASVIFLLLLMPLHAQSSPDATELLQKVKAFHVSTTSWRAEATLMETMTIAGKTGSDEIHATLAADATGKFRQSHSGGDRTTIICDGHEYFYSGDGYTYQRRPQEQCDVSLSQLYEPSLNTLFEPATSAASLSIVGEDSVRLNNGDRRCVLVRALADIESVHVVRTVCIDPVRPMILRDVYESEDEVSGRKGAFTTTLTSFEVNPALPVGYFNITIPPGAKQFTP